MTPGMKMMMLANRQDERSGTQNYPKGRARMGGYERANYMPYSNGYKNNRAGGTPMTYDPHMGGYSTQGGEMRMGYDMPESNRDDNGRFAPARDDGDIEIEMYEGFEPSMGYQPYEQQVRPKMQIGFAGGNEDVIPFSQMTAEKWTRSMEGKDGAKGPHWSMDQIKNLMAQKGVDCDPWEFYAAINAMYSDYGETLKKYGVGDKIELYVDLAKDFINDKDAQPDKLSRYFKYIVKH